MKDYHDMLSSLKDKVIGAAGKATVAVTDAAGKVSETVTDAANKVVSDEMRDKVAGAAHAVGDRAKYASHMARLTVDCNAELERVKRTYTEIGRLYYDQAKDAPEGFFAPLFEQAAALVESINSKQAQIQAMKDEFAAETAPAEDADFESVVDATEDDGTAADDEDGIEIEITVEKDDDKEE